MDGRTAKGSYVDGGCAAGEGGLLVVVRDGGMGLKPWAGGSFGFWANGKQWAGGERGKRMGVWGWSRGEQG